VFAAKYQLKRVSIIIDLITVAILNCASFYSLCCLMNRKGKSLNKQCFYRNNKMFCGIKSCNTCSNDVFQHWHRPTVVLPLVYCPAIIRCSKSTQKSAVQVCQVDIIVMETTQLVLSQYKQEVKVIWQKAPHVGGGQSPVRGHPRGSKFVPLNSWGRVSY